MIIDITPENVSVCKFWLYNLYTDRFREEFAEFYRHNPIPKSLQKYNELYVERMLEFMLNFKNSNGEIVMSEKDNGKLEIHDEALKESIEGNISLEEAKKKVETNDEV